MTIRSLEYRHKNVEEFLANNDTSPLILVDWYTRRSRHFNIETVSIEDMVRKVLTLTEKHSSNARGDESGSNYTHSGRNRSALDIWRIIKNFCPTITIYMVMRAIYNIKDEIRCQICSTIKRRVFYDQRAREFFIINPRPFVHDASEKDEFGLYFNEWGDI